LSFDYLPFRDLLVSATSKYPLYLILPGDVYDSIIEWLHPHELKVKEVHNVFRAMSTKEKRAALSRPRTLIEFGGAVVWPQKKLKKSSLNKN
jgi:hypothetical protein